MSRRGESNPHAPCGAADFKSAESNQFLHTGEPAKPNHTHSLHKSLGQDSNLPAR